MSDLQTPTDTLAGWFKHGESPTSENHLHFTPANGIPIASYAHLFECLSPEFSLSGADTRNNWPGQALPSKGFNWLDHANDLIQKIESNYSKPIIGIGHSLGGTITAMAATRRPELFSKLVLIEPATTPSALTHLLLRYSPTWLTHRSMAFIRKSHQRQYKFSSRQQFITRYRNHPTYKQFTERAFADFVEFGLLNDEGKGVFLACHPHWESHNFRSVEYVWRHLAKICQPCLILRAEHSYLYSQKEFNRQCEKLPENIEAQPIPLAGHLVTHEEPQRLALQIRDWLIRP